jgi:hypothetical protein
MAKNMVLLLAAFLLKEKEKKKTPAKSTSTNKTSISPFFFV